MWSINNHSVYRDGKSKRKKFMFSFKNLRWYFIRPLNPEALTLSLKRLCDEAVKLGADEAKPIKTSMIVVREWVRLKCQYSCGGYGGCLTCPVSSICIILCILFHCGVASRVPPRPQGPAYPHVVVGGCRGRRHKASI
ncbi:MAG: hypothetical protein DRJ47_04580 [Thermoprotei archaeon]|nr:MAG: hypothetical protein DRJ47_04580 [Thermoprotei archaeon]